MLATAAWSFGLSFIILVVLNRTIGMLVSEEVEKKGIDAGVHNEEIELINDEKLEKNIERILETRGVKFNAKEGVLKGNNNFI